MNEPDRRPSEATAGDRTPGDRAEIRHFELSDEDIVDAMKHIEGYLDITTEDFREVYALAPCTLAAMLLLAVGLVVNNVPRTRRYPEIWF